MKKYISYPFLALVSLCFLGQAIFAQTGDNGEKIQGESLQERFQKHIRFLADDDLEGRETGSEGERKAAEYIIRQFREIGVASTEHGSENWYISFDYTHDKAQGKNNWLHIGDLSLGLNRDYFPLGSSGNSEATAEVVNVGYGISAPDLGHDDYPESRTDLNGKIFLIDLSDPTEGDPHGKFYQKAGIRERIRTAVMKGAIGLIFYNPSGKVKDPVFNFHENANSYNIPVAFLKNPKMAKKALKKGLMVSLSAELVPIRKNARNVIGYVETGGNELIVLGAHYDHLGHGGEGSLARTNGGDDIHNGADDNASGVAMILELSRELIRRSQEKRMKYNFLILGFTGEEKGLLGSKYFFERKYIKRETMDLMINFDMVGRLDPDENKVVINGAGTSPFWKPALEKINVDGLSYKTTDSGIGPSDHTSFYLQDMPVLHFFSGTHEDYHKPSDDEEKINYEGMEKIYGFVLQLIDQLEEADSVPAFTRTNEEENHSVPRWTVSLGVVPDYMYEGQGLRIDGVSDGKPAQKAGMKAGDIITKMGERNIEDIYAYMEALSNFKVGDKTILVIQRSGKEMKINIKF